MLINSNATNPNDPKPFLPVLIIPGFMSSGLQIIKSSYKEAWEGKRVWLNLQSLGLEAMQFGGRDLMTASRVEDTDEGAAEQTVLRNMWLQHMALADDMVSERAGIQVRNIEGLAGVDYLTPGALTNYVSYVFGPVIRALQAVGYQDGHNLDAAPYDWRLPPSKLEQRDQYFSRIIVQVELLHAKSNNTPVVLVCHSQGAKIGHYFLNFAKSVRGQAWLDRFIHTYMPVGGAHLGAPKALRSTVTGERMGLDAFLSDSEALIFGRSLGSGIGLIPKELLCEAPPVVYMRGDGAIEVKIKDKIDSDVFLCNRVDEHRPGRLKLAVVLDRCGLSTPFAPIESDQSVSFGQTFTFRTQDNGFPPKASLAFLLCEPGVHFARRSKTRFYEHRQTIYERFFGRWKCDCECTKSFVWKTSLCSFFKCITCWCIIWPLTRYVVEVGLKLFMGGTYAAFCFLYAGTVLSADEVSKVSGGSSVLAAVKIASLHDILDGHDQVDGELKLVSQRDKTRWFTCRQPRRATTLSVSIKWIPFCSTLRENDVCSPICQVQGEHRQVGDICHKRHPERYYRPTSGFDIITAEDLPRVIETVKNVYDADPIDPRGLSSYSAPPVRLVKAIYGINLPTEVGAFYKRHRAVIERSDKVRSLFAVDKDVRLLGVDGYIAEDGILKETKDTPQVIKGGASSLDEPLCRSGDGTVPYWSLQHVRTWDAECQVSVDELEGAEHRDILADVRFQKILVDYVCSKPSSVAEMAV
jgi:hypothetical protein